MSEGEELSVLRDKPHRRNEPTNMTSENSNTDASGTADAIEASVEDYLSTVCYDSHTTKFYLISHGYKTGDAVLSCVTDTETTYIDADDWLKYQADLHTVSSEAVTNPRQLYLQKIQQLHTTDIVQHDFTYAERTAVEVSADSALSLDGIYYDRQDTASRFFQIEYDVETGDTLLHHIADGETEQVVPALEWHEMQDRIQQVDPEIVDNPAEQIAEMVDERCYNGSDTTELRYAQQVTEVVNK